MRAPWIWLVVMGACSFKPGEQPTIIDGPPLGGSDGAGSDAIVPTIDGSTALGPWGTPIELTDLDTGTGEDDPSLTSDLLEIYFGTHQIGPDEDIFVAKRTAPDQPWSTPVLATGLNTTANETTAKVAAGGLAIYFSSNRSNVNDYQLYASTRASRTVGFGSPTLIGFSSSSTNEYAPYPRPDLKRLIFCAGATVAEEALWISVRGSTTASWGSPRIVSELDNAGSSECDPMEPNPLTVYFSSTQTGNSDLYVARRLLPDDPYGPPVPVSELNSTSNDRDPWVSADERLMVFSSSRSGVDRLYMTTR